MNVEGPTYGDALKYPGCPRPITNLIESLIFAIPGHNNRGLPS